MHWRRSVGKSENGKIGRAGRSHGLRALFAAALCGLALVAASPRDCLSARIKDIAYINGVRPNMLIGYGLVVGLKRTGDKVQTIFTTQSLANMLEKMGITVDPTATKVNNVAAVMVTAETARFRESGQQDRCDGLFRRGRDEPGGRGAAL